MEVLNEVKFSVPSLSVNESVARAVVSSFLIQADPSVEELSEIRRDREVYIKVRDRGCGIEDIERAMQPLFTTAPEEERSGLGFSVMQSFTDSLKVKSQSGKGTTVIMRKKLKNNE